VNARSACLGGTIPMDATRHDQVYYRDADMAFCPNPMDNTYNIRNALSAVRSCPTESS
jgi:hypothetical protein